MNSSKVKKGVCGKILRSNDLGFKCLDCQADNTCNQNWVYYNIGIIC